MQHMGNTKLIISLIKDDLLNTKLISGLKGMGIDAERYLLGISDVVFELMGIEQEEALFQYYLELREVAILKSLSQPQACANVLAAGIYAKLRRRMVGAE